MINIRLFIISFLIGIGLMFGYSKFKTNNSVQPKLVVKKQIPTSTFSIEQPPSESLEGSIISKTGSLFWESRIATAPSELKNDIKIQQGERLITKEKSNATINFDKFGSIIFSENTDLSFVQTLPIDFVVEQKNGTIDYSVVGKIPLSIRVRNALITKELGKIRITENEDNPIILILTIKGTAQIGFNDLDYVSQVFTLQEGQIYEYNSDEHTAINTKNK